MNKLISVLAVMVIVIPISITVLIEGPNNLLDACTVFFENLFAAAARFGTA
ncbi:MAG: hypothetical protein ACM32O_09330 [Clostridia bacterium]